MNYYTQRKKAAQAVRVLYNQGKPVDEIAFHVTMEHGFPKKFVKNIILEVENHLELQRKYNEALENGETETVPSSQDSKTDGTNKKRNRKNSGR